MNLTQTQQDTLSSLEKRLEEYLWGTLYYGENPCEEVWNLYKEGVELSFSVSLKPYEGFCHPNYQD